MISKIVNKLENKLTPLLLSFLPLAILSIYLILNNMLNEDNLLVTSLAFIVNFMTALIVLFNLIFALHRLLNPKLPNYNLKFINLVLWTIATLVVEYFTTIPKVKWAIILANGIVFSYVFELINQYFKQGESK